VLGGAVVAVVVIVTPGERIAVGLSVVSQVGIWEDVGLVVWRYCWECAEAEVQLVEMVEGAVGVSSGLLGEVSRCGVWVKGVRDQSEELVA